MLKKFILIIFIFIINLFNWAAAEEVYKINSVHFDNSDNIHHQHLLADDCIFSSYKLQPIFAHTLDNNYHSLKICEKYHMKYITNLDNL